MTTDPTETDRLHDEILTGRAEIATLRGLLSAENERANAAIDRETTAEEAEEEQRLALPQALGLGTGAPWDAIHARAVELAAAGPAPATDRWEPCSPDWLAAMPDGACAWAPRSAGDGAAVSHFHPARPQAPATDQAARRERYAAAISETDGWVLDGGQYMIDAVMAVADAEQAGLYARIAELESSCRDVDRLRRDWVEMRDRAEVLDARVQTLTTDVLREAADRFDGWVRPPSSPDRFAAGVRWVTVSLRRCANETSAPPADRAVVLRQMISRLETRTRQAPDPGARLHSFRDVARVLIDELNRMADEAPQTQVAPGTCGYRSSEGHSCTQPSGHLGYHRNVRLDGDEWTSWVGAHQPAAPAVAQPDEEADRG